MANGTKANKAQARAKRKAKENNLAKQRRQNDTAAKRDAVIKATRHSSKAMQQAAIQIAAKAAQKGKGGNEVVTAKQLKDTIAETLKQVKSHHAVTEFLERVIKDRGLDNQAEIEETIERMDKSVLAYLNVASAIFTFLDLHHDVSTGKLQTLLAEEPIASIIFEMYSYSSDFMIDIFPEIMEYAEAFGDEVNNAADTEAAMPNDKPGMDFVTRVHLERLANIQQRYLPETQDDVVDETPVAEVE